ncbi:DivIVA domain-containing protein [Nocardioides seonyuensis]|uniref:DivIVA domain-containing protein n=2 Tax=Nocardioides seonyuensis TaxID=2518371 RepID=A0A4P7IIZ9_9ACTN|nr:DivIVA domain-containing protein [Nocardioides seonyuensis]
MWFFAVLVVLAMGGVAVIASGRTGDLPPVSHDRPDLDLPQGTLVGADLRRVRFSLAVRGYRASEVDALLDRLASQLDAQAEEKTDPDARGKDELP